MSMTHEGNPPFLLSPAGKDYLWGGTRLRDDFPKQLTMTPLAETWECSTHPDGPSIVASGPYAGSSLAELLRECPDYLGPRYKKVGDIPILVKLIDAKQNLSVQVHPDDQYAYEHENGSQGKTEMWYVVDASKQAKLVYGFERDLQPEIVRSSVYSGEIEKYLHKVPIKKGDVFFIRAGTVHALGAGTLVAEIQQNSNITYRLYDYNRTDKWGIKRELHIEKALQVANLCKSGDTKQPMRVLRYRKGWASELLCQCEYFHVERVLLNTACCREMVALQAEPERLYILLCIEGCGTLHIRNGDSLSFFRGDCLFVPAQSVPIKLHGTAQLLQICC